MSRHSSSSDAAAMVVRFSTRQRVEHFAVMSLFLLLALTGFPQKFFESSWARSTVELLGGIDVIRWIHRVCGIVFTVFTFVHLVVAGLAVATGRAPLSMVPFRQDFRDAIKQLRYYLGLEEQGARFDRFDYRQKFEYWGLVLGGFIMIGSGLVLFRPMLVAKFLPGQLIPAAKVMHGSEGLMAFLVVIIWHIWNAHLAPEVFPFDTGIFTGKISRERMHHEHPLELERIEAAAQAKGGGEAPAAAPPAEPSAGDA